MTGVIYPTFFCINSPIKFSYFYQMNNSTRSKGKKRLQTNTGPDALLFQRIVKEKQYRPIAPKLPSFENQSSSSLQAQDSQHTPKKQRFIPFITPTKTPPINYSSPIKSPIILYNTKGNSWTSSECWNFAKNIYENYFDFIEEIFNGYLNNNSFPFLASPVRPFTKEVFIKIVVTQLIQSQRSSEILKQIKQFYADDLNREFYKKPVFKRSTEVKMIFSMMKSILPEEILLLIKEHFDGWFESIQLELNYCSLHCNESRMAFLIKAANLEEFNSSNRRIYIYDGLQPFSENEMLQMYKYDIYYQVRYGKEKIVIKMVIYQSLHQTKDVFIQEKVLIEKRRLSINNFYKVALRTHYDFLIKENELLKSMI